MGGMLPASQIAFHSVAVDSQGPGVAVSHIALRDKIEQGAVRTERKLY